MLRSYLLRLPDRGLSAADVLDGTGVSWEMVDGLAEIDAETYAKLLDRISILSSPQFGAHCGATLSGPELGLVGFAVMSSRSLLEAINIYCRFAEVSDYPLGAAFQVSNDQRSFVLEFFPRILMTQQALVFCVEAAIAGYVSLAQALTGAAPRIHELGLPFPKPVDANRYARLATEPVRFDTPVLSLAGCCSDLSSRITSHDLTALQICMAECEDALVARRRRVPVSVRINEMFACTAGNLPTIDDVAARLSLSKRTLQRSIAAEGRNYHDLVRQFRRNYMLSLTGDHTLSAKQIAFRLGYRDPSSVYRLHRDRGAQEAALRA